MEVDEEYEEKVNLMDLLLPESSEDRKKYVLYGENVQFSSPFEESISSRSMQEKYSNIENKYGLKKSTVILKRLVLPVSSIKQEKITEEDNSCDGSPQEDNSCDSSDLPEQGNVLNGVIQSINNRKKESLPIEEIHPDKTLQEPQLTVRVLRNRNLSLPIKSSDQCDLCKYVFGVTSSYLDHMKICNESNNICKTILLSVIDAAITEKISKDEEMVDRRSTSFRFVCCDKIFTRFSEFNSHKLSKHNIALLACGLCSCSVFSVQNLYEHYRMKHFPQLYIDLIDPSFNMDSLEHDLTFQAQCFEENPINTEECTAKQQGILCQCPVCNRKHSNEPINKIQTVSKPHQCKICKMTFSYRTRLKRHEETHLGIKPFPCNICAMSFTKQLTLNRHMITQHSSESSPFKVTCSICSKELSCKSSLNKHIRNVHSGEDRSLYRLSCPYCPKTLADRKSLKRHVQSHLRKKEYTCADCNQSFYSKVNLLYHIKINHLPEELFKCEICGYEANTSVKISLHKTKKHLDWRYSCDICGKRFSLKSSLEIHQVSHSDYKPFVCQVCGKTFKRECNLDQHQVTHSNERPHLCSICGQSFRLRTHVKQHMAVHGMGENYKCFICNKFFARKRELNVHMSSHGVS